MSVTGNANVTGTLTYEDVSNIDAVGIITAQSDIIVGGGLTVTGISTFNNDVKLLDNDKLKFGIGEDLQIYHDASHSYIEESGTGALKLKGNDIRIENTSSRNVFKAVGTACELFFDNGSASSKKLETTNTGAVVTGILTATTFSGNLTGNVTGESTLAGISSTISDTAVDVFVYDTRKDSDGGAWRKKTQNTSWYNETLGTATRGSRKEFPAVAVIVAETSKVTIYDGDDPDLPMWMVFNQGGSYVTSNNLIGTTSGTNSAISSLNGILSLTTGNEALYLIKFISDTSHRITNSADREYLGGIGERNSGKGLSSSNSTNYIINANCNDVAMTVLPNALVDDATGLPIPTIVVGTDGGFSIINDNGIVTSGASGSNSLRTLSISDDNVIYFGNHTQGGYYPYDLNTGEYIGNARFFGTAIDGPVSLLENISNSTNKNVLFTGDDGQSLAIGMDNGLNLINGDPRNGIADNGMVAYATTSYNTGYMHGDIKGAFLSDTDTTNVNADTLNSVNAFDGTFASSTGWTADSDWSISGGVATCNGNDSGRFIYPTDDRWSIGSSIVVEVTVTAYTSGTLHVSYATGAATSGTNMTATGTYKFLNTVSGNDLIYFRSESFIGSIDNVKIYYAEYDRSVNNNGLIPYGTITKSVVATGADLVAYSGFTNSNYMKQPYNSELDFGTGDFSVTWWQKIDGNISNSEYIYDRQGSSGNRHAVIYYPTNDGRMSLYTNDGSTSEMIYDGINSYKNQWTCYSITRNSGGTIDLYINGELKQRNTLTVRNLTNTSAELFIGIRHSVNTGAATEADFCLLRLSASIPSPEQIKKMYEDEKVLFQENAKATLYGSSDAVTALAYDEDTELLHVGTSAGRSDFQGLRRINNTTTAVTTAISASDDLIAEQ